MTLTSKDPFDNVLQVLGLSHEIDSIPVELGVSQDMASGGIDLIPPEAIPMLEGNPNEIPCHVQVRDDAGNLFAIADVPQSQLQDEELRWSWIFNCIKLIHPTSNTATRIRPMAFILDMDGTVHVQSVHPRNQIGNYPSQCRIPSSTISDLPLQERIWRAEKFALGMLLYEIITSHRPFEGESDDVVQAYYSVAKFPDDMATMPLLFQSLLYSCWSAEFGRYIALGKFERYVHDNPGRFALQVTGATIGVAALVTIPVLGAIGFGALGPVGGSLAAGWQASIGVVEAGSLFALCQSAAMGGTAAAGLIGTGSISTAIALAASGLPSAASLRETFGRKFRRGPSLW